MSRRSDFRRVIAGSVAALTAALMSCAARHEPQHTFAEEGQSAHARAADQTRATPPSAPRDSLPPRSARPVEYIVSILQPQTQTVNVEMRLRADAMDHVDVALPVWRPGRYEVLDPAGSIRRIEAVDGSGGPLRMEKISKSQWRVHAGGAEELIVRYELFAGSLEDRTRHVDDTHAFLSGESVFLYVHGLREAPVNVRFNIPGGWRVATGLTANDRRADPRSFIAVDYDTLIDSPFEIGTHDVMQFDVDGVPHEIVVWGDMRYDRERLVDDFSRIVGVTAELFGGVPYERYVFLVHAAEGIRGATEHVNSTIMQASPRGLEGSLRNDSEYRSFLGLASHEFFHTWNVEQFRPDGLVPYDYDRENYTTLLWVVEGATSYYDSLMLVRADLRTEKQYFDILSSTIEQSRRRPGRFVQPLADASFDAWIKFTKPTPDSVNSTVSFYRKGALVSLMLDMLIRRNTAGERSLDDVMRRLYREFPRDSPGYSEDDLKKILEEISGRNLDDFFARYVHGTEELDLESALAVVGLELTRETDDDEDDEQDGEAAESIIADDVHAFGEWTNEIKTKVDPRRPDIQPNHGSAEENSGRENQQSNTAAQNAYLGVDLRGGVVTAALSDGPAAAAGIAPGDEIIAIDGRRFEHGELDTRLKLYDPGDVVEITLFRRHQLRKLNVTLGAQPKGKWKVRKMKDPTPEQREMYESWLGISLEE